MRPIEVKKVIARSTSALDRYWESFEILYPYICELSKGIPNVIDSEYKEVVRLCCQLVGWELAVRLLRRNRTIKCTVRYSENGTSIVELLTSTGVETFVVSDSEIITDSSGTRLQIVSYRTPDGFHQVFLPKAGQDRSVYALIPETEIAEEFPDDTGS